MSDKDKNKAAEFENNVQHCGNHKVIKVTYRDVPSVLRGIKPSNHFPVCDPNKHYIRDLETGYPIEVSKECKEKYMSMWESLKPKLDKPFLGKIFITGTGGSSDDNQDWRLGAANPHTWGVDPYKGLVADYHTIAFDIKAHEQQHIDNVKRMLEYYNESPYQWLSEKNLGETYLKGAKAIIDEARLNGGLGVRVSNETLLKEYAKEFLNAPVEHDDLSQATGLEGFNKLADKMGRNDKDDVTFPMTPKGCTDATNYLIQIGYDCKPECMSGYSVVQLANDVVARKSANDPKDIKDD